MVGKIPVAGMRDRATGRVSVAVVPNTTRATLWAFIADRVVPDATVYTDESLSYRGLPYRHRTVRHKAGEYVGPDGASTNGIESHWAIIRRAHKGTYHSMSEEHLHRYIGEFAGRHNMRDLDTIDQMESVVAGMVGKRLMYRDLIADNGRSSGART